MTTLPPELRSRLLDLAARIEALQAHNAGRFEADKGEIAFALRQLARGILQPARRDSVRGWRASSSS